MTARALLALLALAALSVSAANTTNACITGVDLFLASTTGTCLITNSPTLPPTTGSPTATLAPLTPMQQCTAIQISQALTNAGVINLYGILYGCGNKICPGLCNKLCNGPAPNITDIDYYYNPQRALFVARARAHPRSGQDVLRNRVSGGRGQPQDAVQLRLFRDHEPHVYADLWRGVARGLVHARVARRDRQRGSHERVALALGGLLRCDGAELAFNTT